MGAQGVADTPTMCQTLFSYQMDSSDQNEDPGLWELASRRGIDNQQKAK